MPLTRSLCAVAPLVAVLLAGSAGLASGQARPVLRADSDVIDIQVGPTLTKGAWRLSPETKPDVYTVDIAPGTTETVTFISGIDRRSFPVREGQQIDFDIIKGDVVCWTRIVGATLVPAATYDAEYRRVNKGRVSATAPEVYELVNIVIALTDAADKADGLVYKASPYWKDLQAWFAPVKGDALVRAFDAQLKATIINYFHLKMNANAFEFDGGGHIVGRRAYDRTGFAGVRENALRPYVAELERFAKVSKFREFYAAHRALYADQCAFFTDGGRVARMRDWLQRRFPDTPPYDFVDVVFSPLVAYSQSATWFLSNGFRTLQPHVNYPYPADVPALSPPLDATGQAFVRGMIVFTETNHGYLKVDTERHGDAILSATSHVDQWAVPEVRTYYPGPALFTEFMNWGLVTLYASDEAPGDTDRIATVVAGVMKRRGFLRYDEFQAFLLETYRGRKAGESVSSLYPRIVRWFAEHNQTSGQ